MMNAEWVVARGRDSPDGAVVPVPILASAFSIQHSAFNIQHFLMIRLTRLNGQQFVMNAEKIRTVEATPDTVVCCETGEKMMVKETLEEVMRRAIDYARVIRRPITD